MQCFYRHADVKIFFPIPAIYAQINGWHCKLREHLYFMLRWRRSCIEIPDKSDAGPSGVHKEQHAGRGAAARRHHGHRDRCHKIDWHCRGLVPLVRVSEFREKPTVGHHLSFGLVHRTDGNASLVLSSQPQSVPFTVYYVVYKGRAVYFPRNTRLLYRAVDLKTWHLNSIPIYYYRVER